ncbi:hypothetical protein Trydic_g15438, partial [Trypoxylus dichotomus]
IDVHSEAWRFEECSGVEFPTGYWKVPSVNSYIIFDAALFKVTIEFPLSAGRIRESISDRRFHRALISLYVSFERESLAEMTHLAVSKQTWLAMTAGMPNSNSAKILSLEIFLEVIEQNLVPEQEVVLHYRTEV